MGYTLGKFTGTMSTEVGALAQNHRIVTTGDGNLHLFFNGVEVDVKANGHTVCPQRYFAVATPTVVIAPVRFTHATTAPAELIATTG